MDGERQELRGRCRRHLCHQGRRDPQLQGDRRFTFGASRCPPQFPLHPREPIVTLASARYSTRPPCSVEEGRYDREGRRRLAKSSFTLTARSVVKSYSSLLVGVHHFTSARQLESSAWICSVRC